MTQHIEYTNLKRGLKSKEVKKFVNYGIDHSCRAVVLNYWDALIAYNLKHRRNSSVKVVAVYGFPWDKFSDGVFQFVDIIDEVDMVIPTIYRVDPNQAKIVIQKAKQTLGNKLLKVIIETEVYDRSQERSKQLVDRIRLSEESGADVIKTNTGLFKRTFMSLLNDIRLIKEHTKLPIKAAGGIRTKDEVKQLLDLGVWSIGMSNISKLI